MFVKKLVFQV